ncbi:MAG: ArsR family transcriptional regulator [Acidimicrobiales bacterium]
MDASLERRARVHAALGDPIRLAIVDDLGVSDRAPAELGHRFGLASNLLAHHLDVLEHAGLIERTASAGDRRRRYVRLLHGPLEDSRNPVAVPSGLVLFVCTHNSARSQLAAALWAARTGRPASSAGTHPTEVHPKAVAAAERAGLDLTGATAQHVDDAPDAALVVTVCDQAHEALRPDASWWHWSTPAPTAIGTDRAFDQTVTLLDARIRAVTLPTAGVG